MPQTLAPTPELDPALETAAQAKAYLERFQARLLHLFSFVPDDRLTWTPSPTAKSSLRIVAHCGLTSRFYADVIAGTLPAPLPSPAEFLQGLRDAEETITTRAGAIALVTETSAALGRALDSLDAGTIDSTPDSPFGPLPMRFWLFEGGDQMAVHAGQLAYLQTIWGDLDSHLG